MPDLFAAAHDAKAWACYDCGKCTATCPIARAGARYSPRRHVLSANAGDVENALHDGALFTCLTCSQCDQRCPAEVRYTELIRTMRECAQRDGVEPDCPHGGALQSVMRMMAVGKTRQDRLTWLSADLKTTASEGDVFYWTGCTMYYDAFFSDYGVSTLAGVKAAISVLNRLGATPVVSPDERCCGHDLLWNGDRENFERLARHNVELVKKSGAKAVVVSCAECLRTWKLDYAPFIEGPAPELLHITEYIAQRAPDLKLVGDGGRRVTFQDPCRLGRHLGLYEPPRKALAAVPGLELVEMRRSGPRALCCAGGTWSHCDRFAKRIQVDRLREARATGAGTLVTACPKCQVHFRCAMRDPEIGEEIQIELRDVTELIAGALG